MPILNDNLVKQFCAQTTRTKNMHHNETYHPPTERHIMDKRKLTKKIVNNTNAVVLGGVSKNILCKNLRTFENPYLNIAMQVGIFVTHYSIADVILEPVKANTDRKIDDFFDTLDKTKKTATVK